ncbi:MAG TPA: ATP-binding protein [Steroidobacteraceae bacterium]|nr:ATP-binding protein [Steroidobacteraceae bacterium]
MNGVRNQLGRLLPSTMFGRLAASLVLVVGIMLAVMLALILRDRAELSMRVGGVGDSSHRIAYLTRELEALQGAARAEQRQRFSADESLRVEPDRYPGRTLNRHEVAAIGRAFVAELRDRLGDSHKVTVDRIRRGATRRDLIHLVPQQRRVSGTNALDVSVGLPDGDTLRFRVAAPLPDPPLPRALFIQLGVLTLALAVVLFLVTRSITRPLSKLALAADAVGKSVRHPPLVEEGVCEIRDATRAFNTMQDRLLRYLDSRTSVLAAMSHDLRTPLTRLRLRVESVSDERLHAKFASDLDEMEALVWSALALFKGLDDDEKFEAVDVNGLLQTLTAGYTEVGSDVSLAGRAHEPLLGKPRALKRCLANLVDNALKFGKRAAIEVDDGAVLVIRIADDGPGIPQEMLERVFEPFYRLDSSRSRDTGGAGLVLSIARDVAQAHGGNLTLRNRPEGGLTAELRLPRRR